ARRSPICGLSRALPKAWSTGCFRPVTTSRCWLSPIRTRWATSAPWCCIRTEHWKGRTIPAPMAARPGFSITFCVIVLHANAHAKLPPFRRSRCYGHARVRMTRGTEMARLLAFVLAALALLTAQAQAHPHVWVTMKSEIVYAADGTATGVRHAWTFDDMFS